MADEALAVGFLTGAIVTPDAALVVREIVLLVLFVDAICCCFGAAATLAAALVVSFGVVVCCCRDDDDDICVFAAVDVVIVAVGVVVVDLFVAIVPAVVPVPCCTPVIFTLENEVEAALFAHSYLAVILFGPGLMVVYFDVMSNFHFE
jgi:hypothetical protein